MGARPVPGTLPCPGSSFQDNKNVYELELAEAEELGTDFSLISNAIALIQGGKLMNWMQRVRTLLKKCSMTGGRRHAAKKTGAAASVTRGGILNLAYNLAEEWKIA